MSRPTPGPEVARHAARLIGTRFRLHGRDPASGLDCIGLAVTALNRAGLPVEAPAGYRLRNRSTAPWLFWGEQPGLEPASGPLRAGDLVLAECGPAQVHLVIAGFGETYIHAHAGLGQVVLTPGPLPWPFLAHWRPQAKE